MKPVYHVTVSVALAGVLYIVFKSWALSISSIISGILIDLDLIFDYLVQRGLPLRPNEFIKAYKSGQMLKVRFFHSWEWVIILGAIAWVSDWDLVVVGVLVGFGQHIFLDNVNYREPFLSYFFLWRWRKDFRNDLLFRKSCNDRFA